MSVRRAERDDAAFTAWVEQYGAGLLRSAYLMTGSQAPFRTSCKQCCSAPPYCSARSIPCGWPSTSSRGQRGPGAVAGPLRLDGPDNAADPKGYAAFRRQSAAWEKHNSVVPVYPRPPVPRRLAGFVAAGGAPSREGRRCRAGCRLRRARAGETVRRRRGHEPGHGHPPPWSTSSTRAGVVLASRRYAGGRTAASPAPPVRQPAERCAVRPCARAFPGANALTAYRWSGAGAAETGLRRDRRRWGSRG